MRGLLVAVLGVLAGSGAYAQTVPRPVALDVVIVGAPLKGAALTAADFDVRASGVELPVQAVRLIEPSTDRTPFPPILTEADEQGAAASASRLVAVYVDEYHLPKDEASAEALRAVARFLRTSLGPRDLVVVLKPLDSLVSIRLDADRDRAAAIVEGAQARQGDYTATSSFERNFLAGAPDRVEGTRRQIVVAGLSALAAHLGQFQGRKSLIVVGNDLPSRDTSVRGDVRGGVDAVVRAANGASVAVYPVRPSVLPPAVPERDGQVPRDELRRLAASTTGFTIDGVQEIPAGLARVLADASRYYLVSVAPPAGATDARFRLVDVRVRRAGLEVRARAGFAVREERPAGDDLLRVRELPPGLTVPRHASALIRPWFGQAPAGEGRIRVDFVWEPASPRPGDRFAQALPARIAFSVQTMEGASVFEGMSKPSTLESADAAPGTTRVSFETAPAHLLVRMDILDLAGRVLDRDVRDLTVLAFERPLSFGTPAVYRARTARDLRRLTDPAFDASPVAGRQFSRTERLIVRVQVVSQTRATDTTVRLLNGFGGLLRVLDVQRVEGQPQVLQVELPLSSLASASYVIEFGARTASDAVIERLEFAVTP